MNTASDKPRKLARLAGVFYLLVIVLAPLGVFVLVKLNVAGDPAATVAAILAHKTLFRLGYVADLLSGASYLVVTALLYRLFRHVDRSLALVAALFSLIGIAVGAVELIFRVAPLTVLENASLLSGFDAAQLQSLAMFCLRLRTVAEHVGITFFGFYCVLTGVLIFRSTFLPKLLSACLFVAGAGWLLFLYEPLAAAASPIAQCCGIGEIVFTLYLLIAGVNEERWRDMAARHTAW